MIVGELLAAARGLPFPRVRFVVLWLKGSAHPQPGARVAPGQPPAYLGTRGTFELGPAADRYEPVHVDGYSVTESLGVFKNRAGWWAITATDTGRKVCPWSNRHRVLAATHWRTRYAAAAVALAFERIVGSESIPEIAKLKAGEELSGPMMEKVERWALEVEPIGRV